ncbi:MAG: hypothetical protein ACPGSD_00110 [Flavobacteriales bacterium]
MDQSISMVVYDKKTQSTRLLVNPNTISKSDTIAFWGENNSLPADIVNEGFKSGVFSGNMQILRKAHYGNGVTLYRNQKSESGKIDRQIDHVEFLSQDIQDFWKRSKMERFFIDKIADLELLYICFPEYILSKDYSKIHKVKRVPSAWCRFELQNEKTKVVDNVYIKSNWENSEIDEFTDKVPLIDFYWSADEVRDYCKKKKIRKFIRPEYYPMMMNSYYPDPEYLATFKNGWLKHANQIPELKNAIIDNELHVKYIIYINELYFHKTYGDQVWKKKPSEEKDTIRRKLHEDIDDHLKGKKGAGRSIKAPMFLDDKSRNFVEGIKVEEVGNSKSKTEGTYLTDATAANQETSFAMGVDPSIIGAGIPGGKLGAGSGSDKREAYTILGSLMKTNRVTSIDSFYFIKDYNGWDSKLHADFSNTILTTLDKNPTGSETKM